MRPFHLMTIAVLLAAAPFVDSLDRGIELMGHIKVEKSLKAQAELRTPQYIEVEEASNQKFDGSSISLN